jgi:hypothetical protein
MGKAAGIWRRRGAWNKYGALRFRKKVSAARNMHRDAKHYGVRGRVPLETGVLAARSENRNQAWWRTRCDAHRAGCARVAGRP